MTSFNQWKIYDTTSPFNFGTSTPSNFGTSTPSNFGTSTPSNFGTSTSSNFGTSTPSNLFNFIGKSKPSTDSIIKKNVTNSSTQTEEIEDVHLVPINLPRNKIEGLLNMMVLEFKCQEWDIQNMIDNILKPVKISTEDLWFMSFIKYSNKNFVSNKVNENFILFTSLYSDVLRSLMIEKIKEPKDLYTFLNNFARKKKNKKMLWLFTILEYAKEQLENILDETNILEMFVLAVATFIEYDNKPVEAIDQCLKSKNTLYKTCLLSMVGASYGVIPGYYNSETIKLGKKIYNLIQG
jgi:hypothetical protein